MSNIRKIACFDTDIIIKMSRNTSNLLEQVVSIFNNCYLHKSVYNEIDWPETSVNILKKLIEKGKIKLMSDEKLYDKIEIKRLFLDTLHQVCEIFGEDNIYSCIDNYINKKEKFFNELYKVDKYFEENLGEIRTLMMIILMREIEKDNIYYFISDDRRARNVIALKYGNTLTEQKIFGVSLMSSFYFLKKDGLAKKEALKFVDNFYSKETKIFYEENRMDKMNNHKIIKNMYDGKLKLLNNGDFLLK